MARHPSPIFPVRSSDEPLQRHAVLSETIGNGLPVLLIQIRKQALHEGLCVVYLFLADKAFDERFHKPLQPRHHPIKDLGGHGAFLQQLLFARFELRLHVHAPSMKRQGQQITEGADTQILSSTFALMRRL
jgi:hypothetical protein